MPHRPDIAVTALAASALRKQWRNAARQAEDLAALDPHRRHALRKTLKKLRYTVEFFGSLLPREKRKLFLSRLKTLQVVFGDLNDAAMAETVLAAPPFDALAAPHAQRAIGRVIGSCQARAEQSWIEAQALWKDLESCEMPWKRLKEL